MRRPKYILNYNDRTKLKEIELAGHKPVHEPVEMYGLSVYRYQAEGIEWALVWEKSKWRIVTDNKNCPNIANCAKLETALRHFISWWTVWDIQHGKV